MNEEKNKAFKKLQNAYLKLRNRTDMRDIEYINILEIWDKISILEDVYKEIM